MYAVKTLYNTRSRAIARKPRDAAGIRCVLQFADIQYKFELLSSESQTSELYRHTGVKKEFNVK